MAMETRWSTYILLKIRGCSEVVSHGNIVEHILAVEDQRVWRSGQQVATAMAT